MIAIVGGESRTRQAVTEAAAESGREATVASDASLSGLGRDDALVDLGLPADEWPAGRALVEAEADRARRLAEAVPAGARVVRVSVIGAAASARSPLQVAQHAAETAWRERGHGAVALRVGILLGDCGLAAGFRRGVERSRIVPLPGVWMSKLEPLLVDDLGRYCVEAAVAEGPFDDAYDLGCGEILTGGLLAKGIAENLGVGRWVWAVPAALRGALAGLFAAPGLPAVAVRHWLEALAGGLLPRGVGAWTAFQVRPVELREAMAYGVGMKYAMRRPGKERFGAWKAPERKGILGQRPRRR